MPENMVRQSFYQSLWVSHHHQQGRHTSQQYTNQLQYGKDETTY